MKKQKKFVKQHKKQKGQEEQWNRKQGIYEKYIKRPLDFLCALFAIVLFSPVILVISVLVLIKLGSPILFTQERPGLHGKVFKLYKFRSMSEKKDKNGKLLPDEQRLGSFGKTLRATSLDELPELFNILKGDMSIVGPRPLLVRDMVFMTKEQKKRYKVRQGLTGLAQIMGRNAIDWEKKLKYDVKYIEKISFFFDLWILWKTIKAVIKQNGITEEGSATARDYGDYLLLKGIITKQEYQEKQKEADQILRNSIWIKKDNQEDLVSIIMPSYNTERFIGMSIQSVIDQTYQNWELILVDDCSTDNTEKEVLSFKDKRIRFLKNPVNVGAAITRNRALQEASGRWIAFLDSDDLWEKRKLEYQIKFMKKNGYHFSYTNYIEIDEQNHPSGIRVTGPKHITRKGMYQYCWPGCLTVMYDKDYVGDIQISNIRKNNDYAIWLKVIKKTECYLLNEYLAKYRKRSGSISNLNYFALIQWHYRLFREAENKNVISSIFYTGLNLMFGVWKKIFYVSNRRR